MIRSLAEYIMRGRLQAGAIVVLGYIVPLLTPVALALVTLRKGALEGTLLLLISLLPAIFSLAFSESTSLVIWITLLSLAVVYFPALILRQAVSLPLAILSTVVIAALSAWFLSSLAADQVAKLTEALANGLRERGDLAEGASFSVTAFFGMIACVLALNGLGGLLLGRWMQSLLFNPGGFEQEFHGYRLNAIIAALFFIGSILLHLQGAAYGWWANLLAIPLILVAIAVAHVVARQRGIATPWLILFYLVVFLFGPLIMIVGFLDTWLNFRKRLQP